MKSFGLLSYSYYFSVAVVTEVAAVIQDVAVLWGSSFITDIMGKKLGKFVPCLQVFEGIVTAWIPGVLLLLGAW